VTRALRYCACVCACAGSACLNAAQPVDWREARLIATGPGVKGPWRQNESRYDYVDDPAVAVQRDGSILVAWVDQAAKDVLLQTLDARDAQPLTRPLNVSRSGGTFSWLPRIAVAKDSGNDVYLVWQEIIFSGGSHGGDILFARSVDGGRTFAAPLNLSRSRAGDGKGRINTRVWDNGSFDIAVGGGGAVHVAWTEYEGALWCARSVDAGRSFPERVRVAGTAAMPARAPSLTSGGGGSLHLAWTIGENAGADIHMASSMRGEMTFSAPRIVARTRGYSDAPQLAAAPDGSIHLVYGESDGGAFGRYHIRYTRSDDDGRTFDPPRALEAGAFPAIAVDDTGKVLVLWERLANPQRPARGLGLAVSADGGATFLTIAEVPRSADAAGGTNGSHQGALLEKMATGPGGTIAIVNSALTAGQASRVWLMRGVLRGAQ
jgi:hypothetical protein